MRMRRKAQKIFPIFSKKFKKQLDIMGDILYSNQVREWEYPALKRTKLR